jgi:phage-related protein
MDNITIEFKNALNSIYTVKMINLLNQVVKEIDYDGKSGNILQITRTAAMRSGIYILQVFDKKTSSVFSQKIIFQ